MLLIELERELERAPYLDDVSLHNICAKVGIAPTDMSRGGIITALSHYVEDYRMHVLLRGGGKQGTTFTANPLAAASAAQLTLSPAPAQPVDPHHHTETAHENPDGTWSTTAWTTVVPRVTFDMEGKAGGVAAAPAELQEASGAFVSRTAVLLACHMAVIALFALLFTDIGFGGEVYRTLAEHHKYAGEIFTAAGIVIVLLYMTDFRSWLEWYRAIWYLLAICFGGLVATGSLLMFKPLPYLPMLMLFLTIPLIYWVLRVDFCELPQPLTCPLRSS